MGTNKDSYTGTNRDSYTGSQFMPAAKSSAWDSVTVSYSLTDAWSNDHGYTYHSLSHESLFQMHIANFNWTLVPSLVMPCISQTIFMLFYA